MTFSFVTTRSETDWAAWSVRNAAVEAGGLTLGQTTTVSESTLGSGLVDLAVDPTGVLYGLTTGGALFRYDRRSDARERLLSSDATSIQTPQAICANKTQLFVADGADGTIATVSPRLRRVTGAVGSPTAALATLAYGDGTIWALEGDERLVTVGNPDLTIDWWLRSPIDIAATDEETYVLDDAEGGPVLRAFDGDRERRSGAYPLSTAAFVADGSSFTPTAVAATTSRVVLAGTLECGDHGLFAWEPADRSFTQLHTLEGRVEALYCWLGGSGDGHVCYALVGPDRTCYALREVTEYEPHPDRQRHVGLAFHRYDSGVPALEWHRLALEIARSSASTQVRLRYHASDDPAVLPFDASNEQAIADVFDPDDRAALEAVGIDSIWALLEADVTTLASRSDRLSASAFRALQATAADRLATHAERAWTTVEQTDPRDVLLHEATGRYLYVGVELVGTQTAAPLLDSITAYCPRQSYLRYLPEVYQDDERSTQFLERFLSVFETSFTEIEAEIDRIGRLFDPDGVPSESLDWLEGWLAADEYRDWPEGARREFLSRAPELYRKRGTRVGVRETVSLYLRHATSHPHSERSPSRQDVSSVTDSATGHRLFFQGPADLDVIDRESARAAHESTLGGSRSFVCFCGPLERDDHRTAIERIVETEQPAHVDGRVVSLTDEFTLGGQAFLGLNTTLASRQFTMGEAILGEDTVLSTQ